MGFRALTLLGCVLLLGCSRTGLPMQSLDSDTGGSPAPADQAKTPNAPSDAPNPTPGVPSAAVPSAPVPTEPTASEALPEVCIATRIESGNRVPDGQSSSLVLVAPLAAQRGPFELAPQNLRGSAFSPHGKRFAFADDMGVFVIDRWPPQRAALGTGAAPRDVAWADDARLIVTTTTTIELHDRELGTRETLREVAGSGDIPQFYIARPSPDGQWLAFAFADASTGVHEVWLSKLSGSHETRRVYPLLPGSVVAWFDWAPNSEHLAFSVTGTNGRWLRPYSVSTKNDVIGAVAQISVPLGENESVETFDFSPDGKWLHYFYERVDPTTNESEFRLYVVDMSDGLPGPSVLVSSFTQRYWSSPGVWSPKSDQIAFHAEFAGNGVLLSDEFVAKPSRFSTIPVKAHDGEFEQVLKQGWSPDGAALYFTAMNSDQVERVYKSDPSRGKAVMLSKEANTRGLFLSSVPGCIAYSQFVPRPAITIVKESTSSYIEVGQPEWNAPDWTGSFDSSYGMWVNDSSSLRGLLYLTNSISIGDTLAWVSVNDCVPQTSQVLIPGHAHQILGLPDVSTIDEWPFQK